jgi:hypothetical protein
MAPALCCGCRSNSVALTSALASLSPQKPEPRTTFIPKSGRSRPASENVVCEQARIGLSQVSDNSADTTLFLNLAWPLQQCEGNQDYG